VSRAAYLSIHAPKEAVAQLQTRTDLRKKASEAAEELIGIMHSYLT